MLDKKKEFIDYTKIFRKIICAEYDFQAFS